ncbi:MAG TPA: hypothetical protein VLP43_00200 [Solirubrobacteraceae bacterium]|nr:hypothetical protein [Solirubrobacteraceae bacterium]
MNRTVLLIAAGALAIGLTGCGTFDSKASGQRLIRDYVSKNGQGTVTLKSVSCPSGIKQQAGHSYDCSVTLHVVPTRADHPGTITIHMESGNKVAIDGRQDVHLR